MATFTPWRIKVEERNLSSTAIPSIGNRGASVIRAGKGPLEPVLIRQADEQRILNIFGKPSSTYPDIWDVIQFNEKADIWVSAPSKSGKYGGVMVTKTGSKPFVSGFSSQSNVNFSLISFEETLGTGDGSTTTFTLTIDDELHYNNQSIDITVDGISINVTASDDAVEILTTVPDVGSGTYVRSSGVLTFTFDTAPTLLADIKVTYTVNRVSDCYFILFNKNPQADDLAVIVTETSDVFTINAYQKSSGIYTEIESSPYSVSLTPGTKNGFGKNIYITDVFTDDDYFIPVINSALAFSTFVDDTTYVDLAGGSRGSTITITELTLGWNYFKQANKYYADIFFDCTNNSGIPALFNTLRNTYQKYSSYILSLPNESSTAAISTKQGYSINNRGIYFYWNWGKVEDTYNNSYFYSPLIGRVAGKFADMVDVYNGLAPSWIDENNHGGQLGSGILELVYDPSESELEDLDTANINPIVFYPNYGVMITSQKTSTTTLSDYSYIGHSRTADYIISNVIDQVLPFQLTKLNDLIHRTTVKSKSEAIVNPLLASPYNLLRQARIVCDETNNTDAVLARREFALTIIIKFTPFSETIKFVFINSEQGVDVNEVVG